MTPKEISQVVKALESCVDEIVAVRVQDAVDKRLGQLTSPDELRYHVGKALRAEADRVVNSLIEITVRLK